MLVPRNNPSIFHCFLLVIFVQVLTELSSKGQDSSSLLFDVGMTSLALVTHVQISFFAGDDCVY